MKKALLSTLLAISHLGPVNVYANEQLDFKEFIDDVKIKTEKNSIDISWSDIPGAAEYKIYYKNSEIYSGTGNKFTHDDLEPGKQYKYNLVALDSAGEGIANITLKSKTADSKGLASKSKGFTTMNFSEDTFHEKINVSTISNGEYIKFDWNDIPQVKDYDVIKNGKKLKKIDESEFLDKLNGKEDQIVYEFIGKVPIDEQEKQIRLSQIKEKLGENATENEVLLDDLLYDYVSVIKIIDKEKYDSDPDSISINKVDDGDSVDNIRIRYTTFIPEKYVENPVPSWIRLTGEDWEEDVEYFGGDNRDFSSSSSKYRTQINVEVDFTDEDIDFDRDVGTSKFYDEDKNLIGTTKASKSGMKMKSEDITQDEAYFIIDSFSWYSLPTG